MSSNSLCVVLLCVFTFWVPWCEVRYDFHMKTMFGSSLPPVVCRRGMFCLRYLFLFMLCCAFILFFFLCASFSALTFFFKLPLRYSLTFIVSVIMTEDRVCQQRNSFFVIINISYDMPATTKTLHMSGLWCFVHYFVFPLRPFTYNRRHIHPDWDSQSPIKFKCQLKLN